MGNEVGSRSHAEKVVCPSNLKLKLFNTGAVDNTDHNPSSTTVTGSLHGIAISLFQHPTRENYGQERALVRFNQPTHGITLLPKQYTEVFPAQPWKSGPTFPSTTLKVEDFHQLTADLSDEEKWLEHVKSILDHNRQDEIQERSISWAAHHASRSAEVLDISPVILCLLPLFQEEAKSVAMILHAMNTVQHSVEFLNPGKLL